MAVRTAAGKLAKYQSMRDFGLTEEPSGERTSAHQGNSFVIQKHAARRLHYDFRLELDGVLLSWSVPKGPSLSPAERRLAVRTEDHPLDYADFEGIIPAGQYGGGTVVVWDRGTWTCEDHPREGMKKGRLTFTLEGTKLSGRWHLVRTRPDGTSESWLLFKGRDDAANDKSDIVAERPESVITGRTVEEITAKPDRVGQSNRVAEPTAIEKRAAKLAGKRASVKTTKPAANQNEILQQLPLGFKPTSLDKVLYPDQGITKGQLIAYLAVAAEWMLPHVANRPLTLVRCPEGRKKPCFFQKHILKGSPSPIHRLPITEEDGEVVEYMRIDDMPGLVALAQLGCLEIHTWGSRSDQVERPDVMVFDLDPDEGLAWNFERSYPDRFTTSMAKRARKGRIFVDYLRNGRNATFIAPYSPRARDGAPVAVPITWEELAKGVDPSAWTIFTVPKRLAQLTTDPWKDLATTKQAITSAMWKAVGRKGPR